MPVARPRHRRGAFPRGPRDEVDIRRRGDRRQRLAAEAERPHCEEVVLTAQLRGCMALEGIGELRSRNAMTIVGHADAVDATGDDRDLDGASASVERILYELLHHRGWPLDHFARCDACCHRRW
jgi:hypothetical protein